MNRLNHNYRSKVNEIDTAIVRLARIDSAQSMLLEAKPLFMSQSGQDFHSAELTHNLQFSLQDKYTVPRPT